MAAMVDLNVSRVDAVSVGSVWYAYERKMELGMSSTLGSDSVDSNNKMLEKNDPER